MVNTVELFCDKATYIKKLLTYKTPVSYNQSCFSILRELKTYILKDKQIKKQVITNLQVLAFVSIIVPLYLLYTLTNTYQLESLDFVRFIGNTIISIVEILLLNLSVELSLYKEYTLRFILTSQTAFIFYELSRQISELVTKKTPKEVRFALKVFKLLTSKEKSFLEAILSGAKKVNFRQLGLRALQLGKAVGIGTLMIQLRYFVYKKLHEFNLDFVSFVLEILYRAIWYYYTSKGGKISWQLKVS